MFTVEKVLCCLALPITLKLIMYEPSPSLSPVYYWREMHEAVATGE